MVGLQDILLHGIDAWSETQQVKYTANNPTPNSRGAGDYTGPAGEPAFDTLRETFSNPMNLALIGVAVVLLVVLVKRL